MMQFFVKHQIVLIVCSTALFLVLFTNLLISQNFLGIRDSLTHTSVILLTKNGFVPSHVKIPKGTTVIFKTNSDQLFWPASNNHPVHEEYPAFDPKKPILPNEEWSFIFTQPGNWKFHDHLNSVSRGEITVE